MTSIGDQYDEWFRLLSLEQLTEMSNDYREMREKLDETVRHPDNTAIHREHGSMLLTKIITDTMIEELESSPTADDFCNLAEGLAVGLAVATVRIMELEEQLRNEGEEPS